MMLRRFLLMLVFVLLASALILGGCGSQTSSRTVYKDGVFEGKVEDAKYGNTVVKVELKDDKIVSVNIIEPTEKAVAYKKYQPALDAYRQIPQRIVEKQSTDVDTVTGATSSSKKYMQAVEDALNKARNP